jgi:hypothetical protein
LVRGPQSVRSSQCGFKPAPVFVVTDLRYVVMSGLLEQQKLTLPFGGLIHFKPHSERHNAIAFAVGDGNRHIETRYGLFGVEMNA